MQYQIVIRPIARRNLVAIERWYDERSEGLSDKFRVAFEETLERINRQPFELTDEDRQELDRRLADHLANPGTALTREEVQARRLQS